MRTEQRIRDVLHVLYRRLNQLKESPPYTLITLTSAIASLEASIAALEWVIGEREEPRP